MSVDAKGADRIALVQEILEADARRMEALAAVAVLGLSDGWIGAGFVRDAVWDHLHGYPASPPTGDVDVLWFAPDVADADLDRALERKLRALLPGFDWSVKNQARMHSRNGDVPYASVADAMAHWPETATAVAARISEWLVEVNAPLGLDDLFSLRLRPTAAFAGAKHTIFRDRLSSKRWTGRYPLLTVVDA